MTLPLSVCMIVKNEELHIQGALESIYNIASDIVIIDTGSDDSTMDIAKRFGARIEQYAWNNDFSYARNLSLQLAKEPCILVMDADERLDPSSIKELEDFLSANKNTPGRVNIKNYTDDSNYSVSQSTRIFPNNNNYRYVGRVHEQVAFKGNVISGPGTNISLLHYGYLKNDIKKKKKIDRNLKLLELMKVENQNDPYISYQMGKTYFVDANYEKALAFFEKCIDDTPIDLLREKSYISSAWLSLCYCLYYMGKYELLINYIKTGIEFYDDYTDLYFIYGLTLTAMSHPNALELIPEVFGHCLDLGDTDPNKYETSGGVGSFKAHFNLGVYWEIVGDKKKAIAHYISSAQAGYEEAVRKLNSLMQ